MPKAGEAPMRRKQSSETRNRAEFEKNRAWVAMDSENQNVLIYSLPCIPGRL